MQRFSAWARWIATGILVVVGAIFTGVVFPVVSHFIQEQPQESLKFVHVVLKFLLDLSEQPWLRVTALLLGGFVAGLWVDWFLRKLDGSPADKRKDLGYEMMSLSHELGNLQHPMDQARARIRSCFATARKLGIWVPDGRIYSIDPGRACDLIIIYLEHIGTMLKDGHFREAKQDAKNSKAAFDKAYAQHRLT